MTQSWIRLAVVLLLFCQRIPSTFGIVIKDGSSVDIICEPTFPASMTFWFRVTDNSMQFITTLASDGTIKVPIDEKIFQKPTTKKKVTLKSFNKERDSGSYVCASINKNELMFGEVTVLAGPEPPKTTTTTTTTKAPPTTREQYIQSTTIKPCSPEVRKPESVLSCDPLMWGPLAGGCGLLVLLLIFTICYCNRIRTRRCPHHYKKQKQITQEKQHAMAKTRRV